MSPQKKSSLSLAGNGWEPMEKLPAHGWMVYPTAMIREISMAPGCVGKIGGETINCNDTNEDQKGECDKDNTQRLSGDARDMADMFLMRQRW